ncbi:MarR family transcriptional regulator [Pseudomonas mangiferae]|uniref:MarR family transcriptional regulator n=2 Tax=Pseudomonas mangiferae TaxID=2593654 RepID=A0A553GW14_9PSED|nr:MarR family transcriptional regulator [Pseudomonas mangiferae]
MFRLPAQPRPLLGLGESGRLARRERKWASPGFPSETGTGHKLGLSANCWYVIYCAILRGMPTDSHALHLAFGPAVAQLARQWRRVIDRQLQPLGLTEATWLSLLHLSRAPAPLRQKELAFSLSLDSSSVVRLLDALEGAGYIERLEAMDRRAKTIHLTAPGRALVEQVEGIVAEARARMLAEVADAELAAALAVLTKVSATLATLLEPQP